MFPTLAPAHTVADALVKLAVITPTSLPSSLKLPIVASPSLLKSPLKLFLAILPSPSKPLIVTPSLATMSGSNVCLDHIPTLEGVENFRLWVRSMKTTLLGEDLWKFVSSGKDPLEEEELGVWKPTVTDIKNTAQVQAQRDFIAGNNKTNALLCRKLSPLVLKSLPYDIEMDARRTWDHLHSAYDCVDLDA
jgi:hypothetical protein